MSSIHLKKNPNEDDSLALRRKQRNLKLVEEKKNKPSDYYYQVINPAELMKIGQSYLEDFKNGIRSFAITSTNYKASQQKTVLALASYFDHLFDLKILIISDSLDRGLFHEIMKHRSVDHHQIKEVSKSIEINHFHHHFDLIDLGKILELTNNDRPNFEFEVAMQNILNRYDIIFWDTPIINTQKNNSKSYSHTIGYFESMTIIVAPSVSKASNLNEIKDHFTSFGVNVKGVLFDPIETSAREELNKWKTAETK